MKKISTRHGNRAGVLVLTALLLVFLMSCSKPKADSEDVKSTSQNVRVITVHSVEKPEIIRVSGIVTHTHEALLSFKTAGIIGNIAVEEGDTFRQGDLLALLDTTEVAAIVANAVQIRLQAERYYERQKKLYADKVTTLQQFQSAETGLEQTRAAERRALYNLRHSIIRSPFDGYVAMKLANRGELIDVGKPVLRVVDRGKQLRVKVGVPSRFVNSVRLNDDVQLEIDHMEREINGKVVEISAVAEIGTGNFIVEIAITTNPQIREGMVARVQFSGLSRTAMVIPVSALVSGDDDRGYVFIVEDSIALRREVRILDFVGDSLLVRPDLQNGVAVVTAGAGYLTDGSQVLIVRDTQ